MNVACRDHVSASPFRQPSSMTGERGLNEGSGLRGLAAGSRFSVVLPIPNPTFMEQGERARSFEVGMSHGGSSVFRDGGEFSAKVNIGQTHIRDITSYATPSMVPITQASLEGLELEASYSLISGLYFDLECLGQDILGRGRFS